MDQTPLEKHSTLCTLTLHLLPGILIGGFFFIFRQPVINLGYPSSMALILGVAFILIPFELGYLLYQGRKKTGRYTLAGVISYRNPIPWWEYLVWVSIVFIMISAIFTFMQPVDATLKDFLFFWIPDLDLGLSGNYSKSTLIVTFVLFFIFINVLGPLVEELYFRGYLLPRIKGRYAILLHSFLFAVYQTFSPWMIITRTIGLLPLIISVKKKNIYIGMILHLMVNSIDVIVGVMYILQMTS